MRTGNPHAALQASIAHLFQDGSENAPSGRQFVVADEERRIAVQSIKNKALVSVGQFAAVLLVTARVRECVCVRDRESA